MENQPSLTERGEPADNPELLDLWLDYLDYYRHEVIEAVTGMTEAEATSSRLPSGWTPAQLLNHLAFMERRWFVWGFAGHTVTDPRGDRAGDAWVTPTASVADLAAALDDQGLRTRAVVHGHSLAEVASTTGMFKGRAAPRLQWILLHVLQEYARHTGQLDVVVELGGR